MRCDLTLFAATVSSPCLLCSLLLMSWVSGLDDSFQSLSDGSDDDAALLEENRKRAAEAEQAAKRLEDERKRRRESRGSRRSARVSDLVAAPTQSVSTAQKRPVEETDAVIAMQQMGVSMVAQLGDSLKALVEPLKSSLTKRSRGEGEQSDEEEETVHNVESVELSDNNTDILNLELRAKLRIPNGPAKDWWTKAWAGQRTTRPVLGASLYLDNYQGATRPSDSTIKRFHDRWDNCLSEMSSND